MPRSDSTLDIDYFKAAQGGAPRPGALLLHSEGAPFCGPIPLEGGELVLGRGELRNLVLEDRSMSRRHAKVTFSGGHFVVEDLGSRNGLVVDGVTVAPNARCAPGARVLRIGRTVFLLLPDLRPWEGRPLSAAGGHIVGPVLARAWDAVDHAAKTSEVLHLHAESGAGKELAARRFHAQGPKPAGPFVAVNCAAIPEGVAERLLFGAQKGAYSGAAADVEGYFETADGGTLFLDEVAELDLEVQAKLLRTIETREVLPLGASKPRKVDLRVVSATHVDLKEAIARRRFREDLFFRLCRPAVALPPLRERPEEQAFLAEAAVARIDKKLKASASLVEACLLREWPGNVRELYLEVEDAARRALLKGLEVVEAEHLDEEAGRRAVLAEGADDARPGPKTLPPDEVIEKALADSGGKVATAARTLGVHRTQLRRWLANRAGQRA